MCIYVWFTACADLGFLVGESVLDLGLLLDCLCLFLYCCSCFNACHFLGGYFVLACCAVEPLLDITVWIVVV